MRKEDYDKVANLTGYKSNKWQGIVEQVSAQFKIIMAGRRSGKTKYIVENPVDGIVGDLLREQQYIWIVAPNYDLTQRIWVPIVQIARGKLKPVIKRLWDTKGNFRIETEMGTTIEAKSGEEPEKLVGVGLTKLVIDEFNLLKPKAWFESLRPSLMGTVDKPTGKAFFIGTPKGKNWGWEMWLNDLNPIDRPFGLDSNYIYEKQEVKRWASFRFTTFDNEHLLKTDLDELIKDMPDFEYRQEILAEFSETAEQVFRNIKNNIKTSTQLSNEQNTMGIDLGRRSSYSVISVVGKSSHYLKYFDRFRKISWNLQIGRIKWAIEKYNPRPIVVDATGIGDPIIEELEKVINRKVIPFIFGEVSKKQLIEKLALWVEEGKITYPDIPILFKEMERFGRKLNPETGKYIFKPLSSTTTDCIMSLGLAIYPIKEYSQETSSPLIFDKPTFT